VYIYFIKRHIITYKKLSMSDKMTSFLRTLPVQLVYRILDNLNEKAIFLSLCNVCKRLNIIIDTYHRYQVRFSLIFQVSFSSFSEFHSFHYNQSHFLMFLRIYIDPLTIHSITTEWKMKYFVKLIHFSSCMCDIIRQSSIQTRSRVRLYWVATL
jgi:hypothetical protein